MVYFAVDALVNTPPCLPAALPVDDLLATVCRPLQPLPPNLAPTHRRKVQASLGQLATVMANLTAPGAGWPAHLPHTPAALLPYLSEEVEAVREAWNACTPGPVAPTTGVLDDWATWVLAQLVACGPEVMTLLEGGAVRLVPVITLTLPQPYTLDLVTRTVWDGTAALAPNDFVTLPHDPDATLLTVAAVLDRLWQQLGDHSPALVALSQGWPVTLLPPGRQEGQGTLRLTLALAAGIAVSTDSTTVEMPPPSSELIGEGSGFQPLAQAAVGVLAWGRIGLGPTLEEDWDLTLVTALADLSAPWGQSVQWGQLWPWLRWWVVQADGEILTWLTGVAGRWLVPGHSWQRGRIGLGLSLRFTHPATQWHVDIMTGTWLGDRADGLPAETRLQGLPLGQPGAIATVAEVRSSLETRLRQGAPALASLWAGMETDWGLPAEPATLLRGTLTLQLRLEALPT